MDDLQPSPAAAADIYDPNDDNQDWDLERAIGLANVELDNTNLHYRSFQHIRRAKKPKVFGTMTESFRLPAELLYRDASADVGPST